jgi:predicted DNA-binding transcriptional regulator AlpA
LTDFGISGKLQKDSHQERGMRTLSPMIAASNLWQLPKVLLSPGKMRLGEIEQGSCNASSTPLRSGYLNSKERYSMNPQSTNGTPQGLYPFGSVPQFLTEKQTAERLAVSVAALRRWRSENRGPGYLKFGRLVRYRSEDIDQWLGTRPQGGERLNVEANEIGRAN